MTGIHVLILIAIVFFIIAICALYKLNGLLKNQEDFILSQHDRMGYLKRRIRALENQVKEREE